MRLEYRLMVDKLKRHTYIGLTNISPLPEGDLSTQSPASVSVLAPPTDGKDQTAPSLQAG